MNQKNLTRLAAMNWPWKREDAGAHIILVSDEQLLNLARYPGEACEKIFPQDAEPVSLREHCRRSAARGATKLRVAFDYFFGGSTRSLYPDTPAFQDALKVIHDVAAEFDLGLEPSIISPLELGVGYHEKTGESGRWMHYREGLRDPQTGAYSVQLWQHTRWCNNKGPTPVKLVGARAFAFRETHIPDTVFFAVDPTAIAELDPPYLEDLPGTSPHTGALDGGAARPEAMFQAHRVRAYGDGGPPDLDRVLVVLLYETVEMDYFSPSAAQFLDDLAQSYHDKGITLAGVYSDEMHIQQDWSYHTHFDAGQFTVRYVSPGLERAFAARFGAEYADFARYLIYFTCHQHDFLPTHEPKLPSQHVFAGGAGVSPAAAIAATLRFRKQYYDFLENTVVDLAIAAREKLEDLNGHPLDAFYHATWAESPTCDAWAIGGVHESWSPEEHRRQYEYTPDFIWSNTVQQAASACANYFAWNEFLTGGNDDTPEGGYADRNYYGRALACSLAALNRNPLASCGMWGMPRPVRERMQAINEVFGAGGHPAFQSVAAYAPRSIEVLFLYPQDLVTVDERFGSWVTQYGYANLITAEKLVEYGSVAGNGLLDVKGNRYRAVCALYEPFPSAELLDLLQTFVEQGGTVVWSGTPPLEETSRITLAALCGVTFAPTSDPLGLALPARQVTFEGALAAVPPQTILTDFVVDRIFPMALQAGTEPVAMLRTGGPEGQVCVGARKVYASGGQAVALGFRPRDDQAASTGVEARTWFEVLRALGAYPGDDNPAVISRTTGWLATTFPNGAVGVCPHYRTHPESWPGGFFRDEAQDAALMQDNPPPDDALVLDELRIAGQTVTYRGRHAVLWRSERYATPADTDKLNLGWRLPLSGLALRAFAGHECTGITLNDHTFTWADSPVDIAWHPLGPDYATDAYIPLYRVWVGTPGAVTLPLFWPTGIAHNRLEVWASDAAAPRPGYGAAQIPFAVINGALHLEIDDASVLRWLYVVYPNKTRS